MPSYVTIKGLIVDSFAGGGGASLGIKWATGRSPDIAINHNAAAIKMHEANHPETLHLHDDVWSTNLDDIIGSRKVGLLWASPDCFAAGTLVLTNKGLVPIEEVRVGDRVLTHKNRWRTVTGLVQKESTTVRLKGHGHYGLDVTPDHEIYSQRFAWREDGERKIQCTNSVQWIPAAEMVTGRKARYWATPHSIPATEFTPPPAELSEDLFWFIGRWVACGSFSKDDVVISCGFHDASVTYNDIKRMRLKNQNGHVFDLRYRELPDTAQIIIGSASLRRWLEANFGRGARNKQVPTWLLGIQKNWRAAFIAGYVSGDGHLTRRMSDNSVELTSISSVSKRLALGIKLLVTSLGKTGTFYASKLSDTEIKGRLVRGRGFIYRVDWRESLEVEHFVDNETHRFTAVKQVLPGSKQIVYCLRVEEDQSFIADGIVVHNCRHFSRAKGDVPVSPAVRGLANVITKWAREIGPQVIILENVREFQEWGPLCPKWTCRSCRWKGVEGQTILKRVRRRCPRCDSLRVSQVEGLFPDPEKKGLLFNRWLNRLRSFGYHVEYRELNGADYGAPTNRRRLFVIARKDDYEIKWPEPTHAIKSRLRPGLKPVRTAAECIDWSIPCPSIFNREPPLVEKTMRRIAMGTKRYVLDAEEPFIVTVNHGGDHFRGQALGSPLPTITKSNSCGLVLPTVAPLIMDIERSSDQWRGRGADVPMSTVTAFPKGGKHALVAAFMAQHNGGAIGSEMDKALATITQRGTQTQLVSAYLARHFGNSVGQSLDQPAPTETANPHSYLVAGSLVQTGYGEREGQAPRAMDINKPLGTVVAGGVKAGLVAANLVHANHGEKQWSGLDEPMRTITTANHAYLVSAFLTKYYGTAIGQHILSPMDTITMRDRFNLVVVYITGMPYIIVDIGMRMLQPHELAHAQGFPKDYILLGSKSNKVARIGNSVVPQVAEAVVRANFGAKLKKRAVLTKR